MGTVDLAVVHSEHGGRELLHGRNRAIGEEGVVARVGEELYSFGFLRSVLQKRIALGRLPVAGDRCGSMLGCLFEQFGYLLVAGLGEVVVELSDRPERRGCGDADDFVGVVAELVDGMGRRHRGSHYDLPIAVGLLTAMCLLPVDFTSRYLVLGELPLDGKVEPVNGVLPAGFSYRNIGEIVDEGVEVSFNARPTASFSSRLSSCTRTSPFLTPEPSRIALWSTTPTMQRRRPPRNDAAGGARHPQCEGTPGLSPSEGPFRTSRTSG